MVSLTDYLNHLYDIREDKDNIYPVGIYDKVFARYCIGYLLSPKWATRKLLKDHITMDEFYAMGLKKILIKYHKYLSFKNKYHHEIQNISDQKFREIIIEYLLGNDWYVPDPLSQTQVNEIALIEILTKYSKAFRLELTLKEYGNEKEKIFIYDD